MKRSIITIIVIIFVAAVCYIAYTLYTQRPLPIEAGASTSGAPTDTVTETQPNGSTPSTAQTITVTIGKDFFLNSFSQTGFPAATAVIGGQPIAANVTVPTNPDGTIQGDPQVVIPLPSDPTYPSDVTISLVAPDSTVTLTTAVTLTQKNQPAITDADWTPVAN